VRSLGTLSSFREEAELSKNADFTGPRGLNLLHSPSDPLVEIIFVHGLRGGSRKTWSFSSNPLHYWPKEWLSRDPEFRNTRIFSFGYNSDWAEWKDSVLNIQDFAKYLLNEISTCPDLLRDGNVSDTGFQSF
jgi:hypothetical protein